MTQLGVLHLRLHYRRTMETQAEKNMENEMETGVIQGFKELELTVPVHVLQHLKCDPSPLKTSSV